MFFASVDIGSSLLGMTRPVRIALVGNSFASRVQLPALAWVGGNEVVGLAGADGKKASRVAAEWSIPHATDDWRGLCALDVDLFIVTTPVDLHHPMVTALLATRAAILCEKPFTLNASEAEELVVAAEGRLALLDHQLRWSPWRRRLRELVRDGAIGAVWSARTQMLFGSDQRLNAPYSWWYDAERGGGILGAIASHMLDALQFDLGGIASVRATLDTYVPTRCAADGSQRTVTADEHARLWLRLQNGVTASLETNIMAPGSTGSLVEYIGSAGTLRLEQEERLVLTRHGREPEEIDVPRPATFEELKIPKAGIYERLLPLYLRDVVAAVAAGHKAVEHAATFADGLVTMRVLDAARRSNIDDAWVGCAS